MPEPLRVLRLLGRANLGGPARQVAALAAPLARAGIQELVVTGRLARGETRLALPHRRLSYAEALARGLEACGAVELPAPGRRPAPFADLRAQRLIARLIARFQPAVVHSHTTKAGLWAAACRAPAVWVHHFHGHVLRDYFPRPLAALLAARERRRRARRRLILCVSESCRRELVSLGVADAERTLVLPPAVPAPEHEEPYPFPLGEGAAPALLFAGRLVRVKEPGLFVETIRVLRAWDVPARGFVFGEGPLAARLHRRARGLPLVFSPPDPSLPELMPAFDLLLLPSRREGLPLAAVEALLRGLPVVGRRVPGLSDLPASGVRLAAADAGPEELARACLEPPEVPRALSAALRARHDPARIAARLAALYRDLADA